MKFCSYVGHVLFFLLIFRYSFSQNTWIQKSAFGAEARHRCMATGIGNRGYIGMGHYNSVVDVLFEDWWEYDPGTNSWTQKADYTGGKRMQGVAFTIGNKGYVGLGRDQNYNQHNDFWEFDPATNMWDLIAPFPGAGRQGAVAFTINNKGYAGTGGYYNDFYEYNASTNTWSAKAPFPATARTAAVGFAIGGEGYIGTGNGFGAMNDFWQYNPATNTWLQKANVPGPDRQEATGFSLNGKGYIGTGDDYSSGNNFKDFYEYDPAVNTWDTIEEFAGGSRRYMSSLNIGNRAFCGMGTSGTNLKDFWEYGEYNVSADSFQMEGEQLLTTIDHLSNSDFHISLFPNPAREWVAIRVKGKFEFTNLELKLFSPTGRFSQYSFHEEGNLTIRTNHLEAGIYFYEISVEGKALSTGKLILQ